jgi:hypothetical protein
MTSCHTQLLYTNKTLARQKIPVSESMKVKSPRIPVARNSENLGIEVSRNSTNSRRY